MRLELRIVADTAEQYSYVLREFADRIDAGTQNDNAIYEMYDAEGLTTVVSFDFDEATDVKEKENACR